jgi:hypothetical protein
MVSTAEKNKTLRVCDFVEKVGDAKHSDTLNCDTALNLFLKIG